MFSSAQLILILIIIMIFDNKLIRRTLPPNSISGGSGYNKYMPTVVSMTDREYLIRLL